MIPGDGTLDNRVTSATVGGNCPVGGSDPDCSVRTTLAPTSINITDLTSGFTLAGTPDSTVRDNGAVTLTVTTNSPDGYTVTVQAASTELTSDQGGNNAVIPIGNLRVRESGTSTFQSLSATTPVLVHSQSGPSSANGDAIGNDFEADIPFVPVGATRRRSPTSRRPNDPPSTTSHRTPLEGGESHAFHRHSECRRSLRTRRGPGRRPRLTLGGGVHTQAAPRGQGEQGGRLGRTQPEHRHRQRPDQRRERRQAHLHRYRPQRRHDPRARPRGLPRPCRPA